MLHVTCGMSHVTCLTSNAYVDPWDMLNNFCFEVYTQKWVFVIMSHVTCHMLHVTCHMSHVKCLSWSLGHAEQFLFSCLCSNVAVYGWKWQWLFLDHSSHITLACESTNHRAGSQLKMSECQTKAGNLQNLHTLSGVDPGFHVRDSSWKI